MFPKQATMKTTISMMQFVLLLCLSKPTIISSFSVYIQQQKSSSAPTSSSLRSSVLPSSSSSSSPSSISTSELHRRLTNISNNNDQTTETTTYRKYCQRCNRPPISCLCSSLPNDAPFLTSQTRILVLQHPQERKKRQTSTVPLVQLCMENVKVVRGVSFKEENCVELKQALENEAEENVLFLYPGTDAVSLESLFQKEEEEEEDEDSASISTTTTNKEDKHNPKEKRGSTLLVLVDGTWPQAHGIISHSPSLLKLKQVMFDTPTKSLFHSIRREPAVHCTSTLETISRALRIVDDSDEAKMAADAMEGALERMVEIQQEFALDFDSSRPRYKQKKMEKKKQMLSQVNNDSARMTKTENIEENSSPKTSKSSQYTRQQRKALRYVPPSKRRLAQLTLKEKKKEITEDDRIHFIYIAHMG